MNDLYAFIDTETTGLNPNKNKLLSIGIVIWSSENAIIDQAELFIKHRIYNLTDESRKVTNFNKQEHEKKSINGKRAVFEMLAFLKKYFGEKPVTLIGQNVGFDISFIKKFLNNYKIDYSKVFSHRSIDTYSIYKTLILSGKINRAFESSTEAFKYFDIKVKNRHTALGDCMATVQLYEHLIKLIKSI